MPWASSAAARTEGGPRLTPRPTATTGGMWVSSSGEEVVRTPASTPSVSARARPSGQRVNPAKVIVSDEEDPEGDVVNNVKELQRTDPVAREQWGLYCETLGGGIRDPSKHPSSFVQNFLTEYESGVRHDAFPQDGQATNLTDIVKEGQRRSTHWKQAWQLYCQTYGGGVNDPLKHDRQFIIAFLDFLGQHGVGAFGPLLGTSTTTPSAPTSTDGERPSKRPKPTVSPVLTGFGTGGLTVPNNSGDPEKDSLVMKIKAFQRSGEAQRQMWWDYCDERLSGIRDPAKHDKTILEAFISLNAAT
uniref:Uncharacterized protein n=1 Tax=Alexandrium catenella TaxID=2925 RepID=A0A7S1PLM7_ALECA